MRSTACAVDADATQPIVREIGRHAAGVLPYRLAPEMASKFVNGVKPARRARQMASINEADAALASTHSLVHVLVSRASRIPLNARC